MLSEVLSVINNMPEGTSPLILVANDHEWSARSLESILLPEGYGVVRAKSGKEALEAIDRTCPDLILLDLQMPDISGIDVCRLVREGSRFDPTVPVLITTAGTGGREARLEAIEAGAWDFLYQPIDRDILLAKFRVYLSARLAARDLRRAQLVDTTSGLYTVDGLVRRGEEMIADAKRHGHAIAWVVLRPFVTGENGGVEGARDTEAAPLEGTMARLLQTSARRADAAGHLGDLEFALVAPRTESAGVHGLVNRLDAAFQAIQLQAESAVSGGPRHRTIRIGAGYCVAEPPRGSAVNGLQFLAKAGAAAREVDEATPVRVA